ncbi:hypothetical protein EDI_113670 [Entamoeba dispar SAW760]|uniref:Uncharacterized protein n=1 Tax=Entamoeba dispar (strain ATCC PRA-260 / SAW760) TaxID=370354 RepID=B0ECM2_ENTDS|nr:uncharacterized protein EDI_113670 [Entamoeba dispar SAW760]EDR27728.1 hypothetical protein EDI_113670 [Entamoeba dispar SAW760]|eukprot:EDR27728.1 hypothetical protein EDI_113670 [Entamoeba dispar SAW760]
METPQAVRAIIELKISELKNEIRYQLTRNLTEDGRSLIYTIAYWAKQVMFNNEYKYNKQLFDYLEIFYNDLPVLLVDFTRLQTILGEIKFFYNPEYKEHMK